MLIFQKIKKKIVFLQKNIKKISKPLDFFRKTAIFIIELSWKNKELNIK